MDIYKKIILAADGSEASKNAVRYAIELARQNNAMLIAINIIPTMDLLDIETFKPESLRRGLQQEGEKILSEVKELAQKEGVEVQTRIEAGAPFEKICELAKESGCDLIVMGSHGRTGIGKVFIGSVTARVIGHCQGKVLVVPKASMIRWENIVIATDGSKESEAAAKEAINLARHCGAKGAIHALAVTRRSATEERIQIAHNTLNEIKSNAEKENIKVDTLLLEGKPHESIHEAILEYARDKNADIIIMGSHGRTGLRKLLMGSVTERLIGYAERAVLVVC